MCVHKGYSNHTEKYSMEGKIIMYENGNGECELS